MATKTVGVRKAIFPFLDLQAQFAEIREEATAAVMRVMDKQAFILGSEVESFEQELGIHLGSEFVVGCASGSDAILLALMSLGIGCRDEVITTPFTFVATASSISRLNARPVFVDIDPRTYNLDVAKIERAITARTRALMPVHLFGLAADMDPILRLAEEHGLVVIEDAAQAVSAQYKNLTVGTLGTLGCFSFFPSKNLGGAGDGGAITTTDAALAERLRLLRVHGSDRKYHYQILGTNSRLDALQAAILRVKLKYLREWTIGRQKRAERYRALFTARGLLEECVKLPVSPADRVHVYNQFVIRCAERNRLRDFLTGRGIPTEIYYPTPLHMQPAFAYLEYSPGEFPEAEAASREALALPIYPELTEEQQISVVDSVAAFFAHVS